MILCKKTSSRVFHRSDVHNVVVALRYFDGHDLCGHSPLSHKVEHLHNFLVTKPIAESYLMSTASGELSSLLSINQSEYLLYLQSQCTVRKKKKENKVISGYLPISPGALCTLPVGFLAPCSRLPGCAKCTSSPTCSVWWYAADGAAPQIG